ncbi:MAG: hypothetical protein EP322_00625 [Bacteroidetes bacterium]|nr:MAG: hypothetical protein EP322_00625 [Bacteroidota bacterium]
MSLEIKYDKDDYFSRIQLLMSFVKESDDNRKCLTNLVVIDLVTSLEVFCERVVRQFIKKFNDIELTTCKMDDRLRMEQSKKIIRELTELLQHEHKGEDSKVKLNQLTQLWGEGNQFSLDYRPKLPKGKHGEVQLEKLFSSIGIAGIFDTIQIEAKSQSLLDDVTYLDIQEFIADITGKRNIAIHEGAPLHDRISNKMLSDYCEYMEKLLGSMVEKLNKELESHKELLNAV